MHERKVFIWSVVIALGGFLFGFDTAVISGAERSIQSFWHLNAFRHGLTISIALIGTVIGSLLGGIPCDRLDRKTTLYGIGAFYLISSLGTALTGSWTIFLAFRFLGGLGVGASSVTAPIYISEISPAARRGKLVGLFQFNVVLGIVVSYLSNYLIGLTGEHSWRLMLGIQALPAGLFLLLLRYVPESPRWLILKKGQLTATRKILDTIDPTTAESIQTSILQSAPAGDIKRQPLFSRRYRTPVMLAILFAYFNQVSGINAIICYAPRIFEMTGLGESASLLSTVGIGIVNFSFTLLAMNVIDRIGRRTLMLIGSFGLIATLGLVALTFYTKDFHGRGITIYLLLYIAFFAFSQGGGNTFLFFCVMMCLQLLFVWKLMPETKGTSLEQMEKTLVLH